MTVFVSGAAGYIGGGVVRAAVAAGMNVRGGVRQQSVLPAGVLPVITGDLAEAAPELHGVELVVHAAGLGHRRGVAAADWRRANVDAPVTLAAGAAAAGVRRFVLISTAYVLGRVRDDVVSDDSAPNPLDDYAASKLEAERLVAALLGDRLTIVRPAAVIGPGAPGNLNLLMRLLRRGIPLPFASIRNRRSFIERDDLARLVLAVLGADAPPAVVLAAHPEPISTPVLIAALAEGLDVAPRLLPCPGWLLSTASRAVRRGAMWQSLAGDFAANPRAALALGWQPAASLREQVVRTARYDDTTGVNP